MNQKTSKIIHYTSKGLLTALMLLSAGMYLFNNAVAVDAFTKLGYPTYLIYPLAVAKLLGLVAIWMKKCKLKEWAYAGFFFDLVLAFSAHLVVKDGEFAAALVGIILTLVAYIFDKRLNVENNQ